MRIIVCVHIIVLQNAPVCMFKLPLIFTNININLCDIVCTPPLSAGGGGGGGVKKYPKIYKKGGGGGGG